MDGEQLFQRGMAAFGALGIVVVASVICIGATGLDYWALGVSEDVPVEDGPIADANGVIYVPVDQNDPRPKVQKPDPAERATVTCQSDVFGPDTLSIPFDPSQTVQVTIFGRSISASVPADAPGEAEIHHEGKTLVISWPSVPKGIEGACVATLKQAPAGP